MIQTADNSGGAAAMRGFYVQTLAALFKALDADPPFTDITLEPVGAQDQFDFSWRDAQHSFAVQVKSTKNTFTTAQATEWAAKLKAASSGEQCTLILVGHWDASLHKEKVLAGVTIEKRSLEIDDLGDGVAHRLARFMEANALDPGTAAQRELMVDAMMGKLFRQAISRDKLTRTQFIQRLTSLITATPRQPIQLIERDIDRITRYAPDHLIGREAETALLSSAWQQVPDSTTPRPHHRCHIISFVALGGGGKTALVANWAKQLELGDSPGWDAAFGWSFYSQGSEQQMAASSELFMYEALKFFGEAELAASNQSGVDKARRLAQVVGARRVLLILDGLEPLQYQPTGAMRGELRDKALAQLLRGLASKSLGLCVLTTRYSIPDLKAWRDTTAPEYKLTRLATAAGVVLLRKLDVSGTQVECEKLVESVQGHALSIHLFGGYLRDAHGGDIRKRDRVTLAAADAEKAGGHAWRVMDAYAQWLAGDGVHGRRALAVLKLLGLFDRPASGECIAALLQAPAIDGLTEDLVGLDEAARNIIFTRLADAGLLTVQRGSGNALLALDAHPLIREYFALATASGQAEAWQAAHRRLYTYLCENTEDKKEPTVDDLQPLYQAVAHGCLAGMPQQACDEVYDARIVRGREAYSVHKLGAFGTDLGAVACFFDQPWQRVSPALRESDQAWLLGEAAFRLRALGRLTEAAEPMRAGLAMCVKLAGWKNAAQSANNIAELQLTLGDLDGAVRDASQAVTHADCGGDAFQRMAFRTGHADALHQVGQPIAATALFCEAEAKQAELQPNFPLLYSLQGFQYCDLLLAAPESCAWRCSVQGRFAPAAVDAVGQAQTCHLVAQRAAQTLEWTERAERAAVGLLDIALTHLTLGRAALLAAILAGQPLAPCQASLKLAVDGLRRAGQADYLARGLLTGAWLSAHTGHHTGPDSAQADLDEAWDIAEAGPMPLFMADIHLHRAGLFHHITPYPWQSPTFDAQEARRLIEKHGYLRRMGDLAAVEQAIGMKPLL
jgi:hypothetical protein